MYYTGVVKPGVQPMIMASNEPLESSLSKAKDRRPIPHWIHFISRLGKELKHDAYNTTFKAECKEDWEVEAP